MEINALSVVAYNSEPINVGILVNGTTFKGLLPYYGSKASLRWIRAIA